MNYLTEEFSQLTIGMFKTIYSSDGVLLRPVMVLLNNSWGQTTRKRFCISEVKQHKIDIPDR